MESPATVAAAYNIPATSPNLGSMSGGLSPRLFVRWVLNEKRLFDVLVDSWLATVTLVMKQTPELATWPLLAHKLVWPAVVPCLQTQTLQIAGGSMVFVMQVISWEGSASA